MPVADARSTPPPEGAALPAPGTLRARLAQGACSPAEVEGLIADVRSKALSDVARALACAEELVAATHGRLNVQARTLRAHVLSYAGRLDEALAELTAAEPDAASFAMEHARVLLAMVQPLARLGRLAEAAAAASRSAALFDGQGSAIEAAKARVNAGIVWRMRGSPADALAMLDAATPAFGADPMSAAVAQSNRAECLLDLDRFQEASAAFEAAQRQFELAGNAHAAAIVEGNLADLAGRLGRADAALPRFEHARRVFEASGSLPDVARLLAEEAELLSSYGAIRDARLRYTEAIATLRSAGLKRELVRASLGLGMLLLRQGDPAAARAPIAEAVAAMAALRPDDIAPDVRLFAALSRASSAPDAEAARELEAIDAILEAIAARPVRHAALAIEAAGLLLDAGHAGRAAAVLGRAALADAPVTHRVRARHIQARLAQLAGQRDLAARLFRDAVHAAIDVRDLATCGSFRMSFADAWHELSTDACVAALDAGLAADAFAAAEAFRARSLLDPAPDRPDAASPAAADLERRLELCTSRLRMMYGRIERASPSAPAAGALAAVEAERQLLTDRLAQTRGPAAAARPMGLHDAAERTPADTASVCFFADRSSYGAFVLTRGRATVHWPLAPRREVDSSVHRLQLLIEEATAPGAWRTSSSLWQPVTARLHELLLAPLAERLEDAALVQVCPAAELHGVPFHAIAHRSGWWHEQRQVMLIPSAGIARSMPDRAAPEPGTAIFIGVSDPAAPGMDAEAASLASLVPGSRTLVGPDADRAAVARLLPEASTVHLATHCVFSPIAPSSSRLRLHDGWMTAHELGRLIRPGAAVVLAGCDSGRTSRSPGEDRQGLVHALLAAGCRVVVHSQWRLRDATATGLLEPVYRAIGRAGGRPSTRSIVDALTAAQREARRVGVHPAWWGPLAVTGGDS